MEATTLPDAKDTVAEALFLAVGCEPRRTRPKLSCLCEFIQAPAHLVVVRKGST